jgi:hypothetical protein
MLASFKGHVFPLKHSDFVFESLKFDFSSKTSLMPSERTNFLIPSKSSVGQVA